MTDRAVTNGLIGLGAIGLAVSSTMMVRDAVLERRPLQQIDDRYQLHLVVAGPMVPVGAPPAAFLLDETEVTVTAYRACVDEGGCEAPSTDGWCNWGQAGREDHPINCVDWDQAMAYCEWAGRRLPTRSEWSYAACGNNDRKFTWGDEDPDAQDCFDRMEKWEGMGGLAHKVSSTLGTCSVRARTGCAFANVLGLGGGASYDIDSLECPRCKVAAVEPNVAKSPCAATIQAPSPEGVVVAEAISGSVPASHTSKS